jgi:hypothetical protein
VDALKKQGVSVDVEADRTEEETQVDGYQQDHDQDQDQDHRQHDVDPDLERDLQTGNDIGVSEQHDGNDRDDGEENGDIDINIDAQIDREETSSELSPTPGPHMDLDDLQTRESGSAANPATNKRNSRSNANSKSNSKSASAFTTASSSSKGKNKDPDPDDKPVKKKHPRPGRPRNPNPPLGAHQVPSNLTPVSLLNNQGMRAKEALGDHSGSAGREVLSLNFASGGGFGLGDEAGRSSNTALGTNNSSNSNDDNDEDDVEGVRSGEEAVSGSSLEESLGLRETCWEEDKDGRVLNDAGKKRVEEIVRGIAGQVSSRTVPWKCCVSTEAVDLSCFRPRSSLHVFTRPPISTTSSSLRLPSHRHRHSPRSPSPLRQKTFGPHSEEPQLTTSRNFSPSHTPR